MRVKMENRKMIKPRCVVCTNHRCVDDVVPKAAIFKVNPGYSGRITRSIAKSLDCMKDFIIIEVYRCMPLLGDEEKIPNWDVHIVHYAIVFTSK